MLSLMVKWTWFACNCIHLAHHSFSLVRLLGNLFPLLVQSTFMNGFFNILCLLRNICFRTLNVIIYNEPFVCSRYPKEISYSCSTFWIFWFIHQIVILLHGVQNYDWLSASKFSKIFDINSKRDAFFNLTWLICPALQKTQNLPCITALELEGGNNHHHG